MRRPRTNPLNRTTPEVGIPTFRGEGNIAGSQARNRYAEIIGKETERVAGQARRNEREGRPGSTGEGAGSSAGSQGGTNYEQTLIDESATASGDETIITEGTLKATGTYDVATEGEVVVIRYKSSWPAKEELDRLTEETRERSDRGFPPYHRMEFSHMTEAPSSSVALARRDVTRNIAGIRLPAPEKIADWRRAFLGKRGSTEQEDDSGAYRSVFKDHVGKSQMGLTPRDIRPYAATVYEPEGLIIDRVIAALQGQSKANGGVLLYSHIASAENLAHFMKTKFVLNERDVMVKDIEKTEATMIPRNSETDYYVQYKDLLEDVISPLAFERRRIWYPARGTCDDAGLG